MTPFDATLERFRDAVRGPAEEVPMARAALLIAQVEYPDADLDGYERRLQDVAETLSQQLARQPQPIAAKRAVQTANQLLFRELGFRGNADHYDDPRNLYLTDVLRERRGVPVTLAIVYAEVCQRAGLNVRPVGLPGHVICRYTPAEGEAADALLVDVFNGGRVLTRDDCQTLVRNTFGARAPFREHYLANLAPRQVIQRVLHNLKAGALQRGDEERAARTIDLLLALYPWDLDEIRDRGMLRERLGEVRSALTDLEQYVRYRAGARDIQTVAETVRSLRRHVPEASPEPGE
ncbi:MAG: tetratricopeptide repeat protein [Dehalococcoidia bacterium]|nr:tetratricopeptide repeat protein [Dehalococcoidia bacterium]